MVRNGYEIDALLARSEEWRFEAMAAAAMPAMRAYCFAEAARFERMVQRSIAAAVIAENRAETPFQNRAEPTRCDLRRAGSILDVPAGETAAGIVMVGRLPP